MFHPDEPPISNEPGTWSRPRLSATREMLARSDHSSVDDFLEGEDAYHRHDYKKAIQAFRRVLSREPDHFWAQYLLAICHLKERRPSEAQAA